ncbi:hypothetical protein [Saccharopolyspora griseoalba]|uniref:Uncharacterized protein n=1 Tax=Saccharopolyspora griseoalba TaxID=1431848 RepID=A0ABW2LPW5_9PSEU
MGWAVGWEPEHRRFRGYGVPAYCDAVGCGAEITRGMGDVCECSTHEDDDPIDQVLFVCGVHTCADVDETRLPREHTHWVRHLLTDASWSEWRDDNPHEVAELRALATTL